MSNENTPAAESASSSLPAADWADPSGQGLMASMDAEFDGAAAISASPDPVTPEPVAPVPDAPVEPVKPLEESEPVIEEDFFSDAPEKPAEEVEKPADDFDAEAFDKQTEDDTKGMDAKAGAKWKELRGQLKELKQAQGEKSVPADVQAKLSELEIKAAEVDGLKARISEISSQSAKLRMESEAKYQESVVQPAADIFARADALAEMYEGEPSILRAIIKERDRKTQNELVAEHLKDFSDFDRSEVYRMVQDFNGVVATRQKLLDNAEHEVAQIQKDRQQSEVRTLEENRMGVQKEQKRLFDKYKEVIPGFTDDQGETKTFRDLMGKALAIDFSQARTQDMALAAFSGSVLPHVMKELYAMKKELAQYHKADGKAVAQRPRAGASVAQTPAGSDESKSFLESFQNASFT